MIKKSILLLFLLCYLIQTHAQETIFADYFDIRTNSPEGSPVIGGIHIERNKDVAVHKIPTSYHFEIERQKDNLFAIKTTFEPTGRIVGQLYVNKGMNTGNKKSSRHLDMLLMDGDRTINRFSIHIKIVEKTLWETFHERHIEFASKSSRLYGRKKLKDTAVEKSISYINQHEGRLEEFHCYTETPSSFKAKYKKTIDTEWEAIADHIGQLGYAYNFSKQYGRNGDQVKHQKLKEALFKALWTYISCVPIEGDDVLINGKPIGKYTGDATSLLPEHKLAISNNMAHHWRFTDALILPVLSLMPDIVKGTNNGNEAYIDLHQGLIRYFQLFTAIIQERRTIYNNPRWGEITDTRYSGGAWSDANLGHRLRTMLALPVIWADYNRPMTYVPYWYRSFYNNNPYEGFCFSPGWSPCGVVKDVARWMTMFGIPSHHYGQSGFHPDGTVSHHVGHATDAAMVAYGFEWLTNCSFGFQYFKGTDYEITSPHYQFQADRLLHVYPRLFYKNRMDFLVAGRSYLEDMNKFVAKTYCSAIKELDKAKSKRTHLTGMDSLQHIARAIKKNTFEYSGTDAYWVNEFLVHRRGEHELPFYASVKLKSERTVGIEDFSKVRKSWHGGYGILQVKVNGDEYDHQVLSNFDWHALPGLTEEWRTDALPAGGGSQASLPGKNKIAGVLTDSLHGMAIYHHLPAETYSSASAHKSYFFIDDRIIALGNNIARMRKGQHCPITTFIDQTKFYDRLTWKANGKEAHLQPSESVVKHITTDTPCWFHMGKKGYIILPKGKTMLTLTTGSEINITDPNIANNTPNFILSVDHGIHPDTASNHYAFIEIPNVDAKDMYHVMKDVINDIRPTISDAVHTVYSDREHLHQFAFFKPCTGTAGDITLTTDAPTMLMLQETDREWLLSVGNPAPDGSAKTLRFTTNAPLPEGTYIYKVGGVHTMKGETIDIKRIREEKVEPHTLQHDKRNNNNTPYLGTECTEVIVHLPDITDEKKYNYQSDLYAATPIIVRLAK